MWVLVTQELDGYLFREGYLRTSSTPFAIDPENVDDKFVHLTNNAVQKYATNYGDFEDGNQLSFQQFQVYLDTTFGKKVSFEGDIMPQIKSQVLKTFLAVRKKLNPERRRSCFEIFGYDFMLDADFNVWLIEINTNPCLEESSKLLCALIPRMVDDALKLTIDTLFPPISQYVATTAAGQLRKFPVKGHSDDVNMWYSS